MGCKRYGIRDKEEEIRDDHEWKGINMRGSGTGNRGTGRRAL